MGVLLSLLAAVAIAGAVDQLMVRRGLLPPGFEASRVRRFAGAGLVAVVMWVGITSQLATFGSEPPDVGEIPIPALFAVHAMLAAAVAVWLVLAFAGSGRSFVDLARRQLGLGRPDPREIALGIVAGVALWLPAILCSLGVAVAGWALGWVDLEAEPPAVIPWLVGQTLVLRLALALSAGFFEEVFFRGFLQPRVGVGLSTVLFVAAHAGYGQLPLLGGVAFLSIGFAALVRWRGSLQAAIVAHATFDAVQLLVVLPYVLRELPELA